MDAVGSFIKLIQQSMDNANVIIKMQQPCYISFIYGQENVIVYLKPYNKKSFIEAMDLHPKKLQHLYHLQNFKLTGRYGRKIK